MNWTWFVLGVYGLIGISRFAWAMWRKATWDKNIWAQETIRNLHPIALFVTVLFEVFLWPVEIAICFYVLSNERRKKKESRHPYVTGRRPYKICTNAGCTFRPGTGNVHDPSCPGYALLEQCSSTLEDPEGKNTPPQLQCSKFMGHEGLHEAAGMRWVSPR